MIERISDRRYGCDEDKATVVVKATTAIRIIEVSVMSWVEVPKVMLDVIDLVKYAPDVPTGIMGCIEATEVDVYVVVDLDNLQIFFLQRFQTG